MHADGLDYGAFDNGRHYEKGYLDRVYYYHHCGEHVKQHCLSDDLNLNWCARYYCCYRLRLDCWRCHCVYGRRRGCE